MKTTVEIWEQLVKDTEALKCFETVKAYPLNRIADAAFVQMLQGLKSPGCLITFRGYTNPIEGATEKRDGQWAAIIFSADAGGDAYATALGLVGTFVDEVLGRVIMENDVWVKQTHSVDVEPSGPRIAVYTVTWTCSQIETYAGPIRERIAK